MDTITSKRFLELLEKVVTPSKKGFTELAELFSRLESEWMDREEAICELKDRELEGLESQLKDAHRREQFINQIGQQLTSTLDLDSIVSIFHKSVNSWIPVDRILLAFYQQQDDALLYRVFEEDSKRSDIPESVYLSSIHRMVADCVRDGKILVINDLTADENEFIIRNGGSVIISPLRIEGCVRGTVLLQSDIKDAYQNEHEGLLRSIAPFLSVAVLNARSHEEVAALNSELEQDKRELISAYAKITKMANYDTLTDLPNLRLLNEFLPRYMEQAKRQGWTLAVFFIDLDDFKPVNDNYGHEIGDKLLIEASDRIRRSMRRSDVVARVGGDEFIALVQGFSGEDDVIITAGKILKGLEEPFHIGETECRIGASIGISLYPGDGLTPEELKNNADKAMYYVKGRNKAGYAFFNRTTNELL
ncbi:MAG: GGDEF domain-containing protein [Spirochaetales bacterium]|nr:GGDEF domain-containing protein [Spirochaetales bacterium]